MKYFAKVACQVCHKATATHHVRQANGHQFAACPCCVKEMKLFGKAYPNSCNGTGAEFNPISYAK